MAHGKSPKHIRKVRAKATSESGSAGKKSSAKTAAQLRLSAADASLSSKPFDRSVRLQKLLASAGFGSRRVVEQYIVDERVTVNGRVAQVGDRANPVLDDVRLDGERLLREKPTYWILNKPRGVVTTVRDNEGRRTVIDLLPKKMERLFPVGRLDRETSGLLLMTNDGDLAHTLLHPSLGNEREYKVSVKGHIDPRAVARMEKGVPLDDGRTAPGKVSDVRFDTDTGNSNFSLVLVEGRKRQIRRSLLILGFPVRRLVRIRMGTLRLGRLGVGESRPLRPDERRNLLAHAAALQGKGAPAKSSPKRKPATRATTKARPSRKTTEDSSKRPSKSPSRNPRKKTSGKPTSRARTRGGQRGVSSRKGTRR